MSKTAKEVITSRKIKQTIDVTVYECPYCTFKSGVEQNVAIHISQEHCPKNGLMEHIYSDEGVDEGGWPQFRCLMCGQWNWYLNEGRGKGYA